MRKSVRGFTVWTWICFKDRECCILNPCRFWWVDLLMFVIFQLVLMMKLLQVIWVARFECTFIIIPALGRLEMSVVSFRTEFQLFVEKCKWKWHIWFYLLSITLGISGEEIWCFLYALTFKLYRSVVMILLIYENHVFKLIGGFALCLNFDFSYVSSLPLEKWFLINE